jgi:predicted house-cleaning noncanonical NTP pyrophosphatase (MazG superfamily)
MKIITVCGSMKFIEEMKFYTEKLELEGNCVLSVIYGTKNNESYTPEEVNFFQIGHLKRIDLSDAIFVVNKNGYIGEAVKNEIEYAKRKNKEVIYLENNNMENKIISYRKLVRDNIINIIEKNGKKAIYEILSDEDFSKELNKKLTEEVDEFIEKNEVEEIADIFEVLYTIIESKRINIKDIEKIMVKKREERGGFKKKLYLKEVIE